MKWLILKRVLKRRQREALFETERFIWEESFSAFTYVEEREVFFDGDGRVVLSRHYTRRLLDE